MKKILFLALSLLFVTLTHAQEYKWSVGFYGDMELKAPEYYSNFGMQAKYDLDKHSALQAQVFGRSNYVGIAADYLFAVLNKEKNDFNVFIGPGIEQTFAWARNDKGILQPEDLGNYFSGTGQVGANYYFRPVRLSVFAAYKVKYMFKNQEVAPNFVSVGLHYHMW